MDLGAVSDWKFLKLEPVPLVHHEYDDTIHFIFLQPSCLYVWD